MEKNQRGFTLVELLSALALLSLILILSASILLFGQKQMNNQSSELQNQSNVRLAMNIITEEIRKASSVSVSNNVLTINNTDVYKLDNNYNLTKNDLPLISNLNQFSISLTGDQISISIADRPVNNLSPNTLSTTIYIRR